MLGSRVHEPCGTKSLGWATRSDENERSEYMGTMGYVVVFKNNLRLWEGDLGKKHGHSWSHCLERSLLLGKGKGKKGKDPAPCALPGLGKVKEQLRRVAVSSSSSSPTWPSWLA